VLTLDQLKVVANQNDVRFKSNVTKDKLVRMLAKKWPFKSNEEFLGPSAVVGSKPPFHQFYAENFNFIDRFNKYYYATIYKHKQMDSGPVRIWSLLNITFVNAWARHCELHQKKIKIRDFTISYVQQKLQEFKK